MNKHEELSIHMSKCYIKLIQDSFSVSISSAKANNIDTSVLNKLINIYGTLELLNHDLKKSLPSSKHKTNHNDDMYSLIKEHINSYSDIKLKNDFLFFADEKSLEMFEKTVKDSLNESKKIKAKTKRKITMLLKESVNAS